MLNDDKGFVHFRLDFRSLSNSETEYQCCSQDEVMGKQISILSELLLVVCNTDVIAQREVKENLCYGIVKSYHFVR